MLWSKTGTQAAPDFCDGVISWSAGPPPFRQDPLESVKPFLRAEVYACQTDTWSCHTRLDFRVATHNVLSLQDPSSGSTPVGVGLNGAVGRVSLLAASLKDEGVMLAGLQETRTKEGSCRCGEFLRLCSGCDSATCLNTYPKE